MRMHLDLCKKMEKKYQANPWPCFNSKELHKCSKVWSENKKHVHDAQSEPCCAEHQSWMVAQDVNNHEIAPLILRCKHSVQRVSLCLACQGFTQSRHKL